MIKAEAKYTPETLKAFRDYAISQPAIKKIIVQIGMASAFVLAIMIYEIINSKKVDSFGLKFYVTVFLVFGAIYIIRVVKVFYMAFSIDANDDIHSYTFDDEQFTAVIENEHKKVELFCQYEHIKTVVENKNYWYITTHDTKTYIVGTDKLTEGTPDELRKLLKDKLGEMYIVV